MLRKISRRSFNSDFGLPLFLVDNLATAFSALDTDQSGTLEPAELRQAVQSLFPTFDDDALDQITDSIVKGADDNHDGKIDFDEFMRFVERRREELDKTVGAVRFTAAGCGNGISAALVDRLSAQCLSSMFYTFAGGTAIEISVEEGDRDVKPSSSELRNIVAEIFPDLPDLCTRELEGCLGDILIAADQPVRGKQLVTALTVPFEHTKYKSKKLIPLGQRSAASSSSGIAELRREDSVMETPLSFLGDAQVELLYKHIVPGAAKKLSQQYFRDAASVQVGLRECFTSDGVDDELIEDVTNILCRTQRHGSNFGVGEFLRAIQAVAHQAAIANAQQMARFQFYSYASLPLATFEAVEAALSSEEMDLLRDTFIRLDMNGDGLVSESDCAMVTEDVLEDKFETFQPYLHALFAIADKDGDERLSLGEFLLSFLEGPGVVPQEIITSCVAPVRLRLSDEELSLVQRAFHCIDADGDGTLDFEELFKAVQTVLRPLYPEVEDKQYQNIVDVILSKADRDMDGKLNISEFCRSLQEEHGVVPIQLIEAYGNINFFTEVKGAAAQSPNQQLSTLGVARVTAADGTDVDRTQQMAPVVVSGGDSQSSTVLKSSSLLLGEGAVSPGTHFSGFEEALSFLTLDDIAAANKVLVKFLASPREFNPEASTRQFLLDELSSVELSAETIHRLIDVFIQFAHKNAANEVTVADVIRRFSLGKIQKPKKHSTATAESTHALHGSVTNSATKSDVLKVSPSAMMSSSPNGGAEPNGSSLHPLAADGCVTTSTDDTRASSVAEVYVPSAEATILEKMFARFDADLDGFLSLEDVAPTMRRLFEERHSDWTKHDVDQHIVDLFRRADEDGDSRLSYNEFAEAFRSDHGLFPDDYVQALSEQVLLDLHSVNLRAILESLERVARAQEPQHGFVSQSDLADELERVVTPFVEEGNYARVRIMVDYMMLFCPHSAGKGRVLLGGLLRFIRRDLLGEAEDVLAAQPDQAASLPEVESTQPQLQSSSIADDVATTAGEAQAPIATEHPVAAPPSTQEPPEDLPPMPVAPFEWSCVQSILSSIAQASEKIAAAELTSKLQIALMELFLDDQAAANEAAVHILAAAKPFVNDQLQVVEMEAFVTCTVGTDVPSSALGFSVKSKEDRRADAVQSIYSILTTSERRRALAEALLQVDVERTGEINFDLLVAKIHEPLRDLPESTYHRLVRALRLVGERTVLGTFSISEFLRPFATVYYVEPEQPLPREGLLRRLSTREEELLIEVIRTLTFAFEDTGAPHDVKIAELAKALEGALVAKGFTDSVTAHDTAVISQLVGELAVTGEHSLEALQQNMKLIHLPWSLLPSRPRCEYALRKLRVEVGEAPYLRKLCRVMLLADRHRNGVFSHSVLSEVLFSELRLLHRDWSAHRAGTSVEEWILAGEVDEKNFIHFGRMMDTMLDLFPLAHPALVGEVRIQQPLVAPDALRAALSHLCEEEETPVAQFRHFSSDGNGPVSAILNFFGAVAAVPARGTVNVGAVYPACRFDADGMTVLLDGLDQLLAQRAIFHVLPVSRQRDLSCAFTVLDHKHDNVLDFEELEGVLMHHERSVMKAGGVTKATGGIRSGRLVDLDLLEKAKNIFAAADKLKLGLIGLEDFLAIFARGVLQYDLLESVIAVSSDRSRHDHAAADEDVVRDQQGNGSSKHRNEPHKPSKEHPNRISMVPGPEEINEDLERQFATYDRKKTGYLSRAEFAEAYLKLEHFGLIPSRSEIDKLFGSICCDKEQMSFDEFCVIMLRRSRM